MALTTKGFYDDAVIIFCPLHLWILEVFLVQKRYGLCFILRKQPFETMLSGSTKCKILIYGTSQLPFQMNVVRHEHSVEE